MPVVICPAPYFGVEFINQIGGRLAQRRFDDFSDTRQESFDILLGRFDEQFPIAVPAHVLSEKIKALRHGRDDCLRRRKFKPAFSQKLLDEELDFSFQQFFRFAGDDKVIRITNEIHRRIFTSQGSETCSRWVLFLKESFQSIQRAIGKRWGDNSALWSSIRCFVKDVIFHISGFQPLLENSSIRRDMSQKPIVRNSVETALD